MPAKRILKLVNTPIRDDPRAVNEGLSLVRLGYQVTAIGLARDAQGGQPARALIHGMETTFVPMVTSARPSHLLPALWALLRGHLDDTTQPPVSRTSNLISFIFFNLWLLRVALRLPADYIHCHDVLPLPAAWVLSRWHRVPLIYDARESVPDLYPGRKGRLMAWIEQFVLVRADAVITVGERLADSLKRRGAKQVVIVGNWKRLEDYAVPSDRLESERQRLQLRPEDCVISYFGALDPTREVMPLVDAVAQLPHVVLLIGGRGMIEAEVKAAAARNPNIRWLGWVPMGDVPLYTHLSTAVYYCLNFDQSVQTQLSIGNNYYSTPNKLFEAFAAGKPIIARRGIGEIGAILEQIPAGILLEEVTTESLKIAIQQLMNPAARAMLEAAALQGRIHYNWSVAEQRLAALYQSLGGS
ncbi:MAG: glycosyltransferase [Anaerolineae bacterium]|nr:glycosyltransferase [Anaerolineae bacterium]